MSDQAAWKVDFTLPPNDTWRWTRNMNATVVAATLERVVCVVKDRYPESTLVAIHRVGSERQVIVDEAAS